MDNKQKIKLLNEIEDLIIELGGIDGMQLQQIGITMSEYENPTVETVKRLRDYVNSLQQQKENSFNL